MHIRVVQELLGHRDARLTIVCTHLPHRGAWGVRRPAALPGGAGFAVFPDSAPGGRVERGVV
jgi:hypothetical protein